MKRILSITGILALAILFASAISIRETPQGPPRGGKAEKHIKVVKDGDNGKKVEIDTVMNVDEVLIWNGDTIDSGKAMKMVSKEDFDIDFDFDIESDEKGNVFIMKSGDAALSEIYEFTSDGDSTKQYRIKVITDGDCEDVDIMKWHSKGDNEMFFEAPHGAHKKMMFFGDHKNGNIIDLTDPGIISFEKKELKDGKEKITIVREIPSEEDVQIHKEIIMHGAGAHPMIIREGHGGKTKQIKVIAGEDGKVEIFENGKLWSLEEGHEDVQVIEKEGKKIIIKKHKKDGEMKVDVEVEEEIHKE